MRPLAALVALAALALGGCGYTSSYVPPPDGRARVGWVDGKLTALLPPPDMQLCYRAPSADGASPPVAPPAEVLPAEAPRRHHVHGGGMVFVWVPYVPPPVVVGGPVVRARGHVTGRLLAASSVSANTGGRGDGVPKEAAVVIAVALLVAMPVISIALAADPPGIDDKTASAIDQVNETNDGLRQAATPCAAEPEAAAP